MSCPQLFLCAPALDRRKLRGECRDFVFDLRLKFRSTFFDCRIRNREVRFVGVVEQREQAVVIGVRNRVVLVRVTLSTPERQAQPDRASRRNSIDHRVKAVLVRVDATLFVEHRVPMKTRGDPLRGRRAGKHVSGQLLDRELIERHVRVEGVDDPVAVRPDRSGPVLFVAIRVRIPRQVEPQSPPPLAIVL